MPKPANANRANANRANAKGASFSGVQLSGPIADLRRVFGGDEKSMRSAIAEAATDVEALEAWATECLKRSDANSYPFRITQFPGNLRVQVTHALSVALLVATMTRGN